MGSCCPGPEGLRLRGLQAGDEAAQSHPRTCPDSSARFHQVSGMLDRSLTSLLLLNVHLVLLHLEDFLTDDLKLLELRCHYFVKSVSGTLSKAQVFDRGPKKQPASPCTAALHHGQRWDSDHLAEECVEEPLQSCWQVSYWRACDSNSILMPSRSSLRRPMF